MEPGFIRTSHYKWLFAMPSCELVTIGSELLNGSVLNTNAQFLARKITALSIEVAYQVSCKDREQDILDTLSRAFERSDLIIVTGGLGPTPDDITREVIAKFFHCPLKFNPAQYRHILHHFRTLRKVTPLMTRREAFLPEAAKPLLNRFGIALGFYIAAGGKLLITLPGVPRELVKMYETRVEKLIKDKFPDRPRFYFLEAHTAGLHETQIMRKLGKGFFAGRKFEFGIYPKIGEVTIRVKTQEKNLIPILHRELVKKLKGSLYSCKNESFSAALGMELRKCKKTLAIAESCTGGLLAERITDPPGASQYFKGSIVAYSNQIKFRELGVPMELIQKEGAVSAEVAQAMAKAIRIQYQTSIGLSITGVAGPSGGTRLKPIGLVYIAISDSKRNRAFRFRFLGERDKIRLQATQKALFLLWQWLARG